jgi:hypothetical protein
MEIIGVEEVGLTSMVRHLGLQRYVKTRGPCSYLLTLDRLAASTVSVLIEAPCKEGIFLPSKLVDYLQVGRPVLAVSPMPGTVDDLIREHGGGLVAKPDSTDDIEQALRTLFRAWRGDTLDNFVSPELYNLFRSDAVLDELEEIVEELRAQNSRPRRAAPFRL